MTTNTVRVMVLFFIGGFISGILTMLLGYLSPWVIWTGVGILFLLGLVISFVIARKQGWLSVTASTRRILAAGLITVASYTVALWVVLFPLWLFYQNFLYTGTSEELSRGGGTAVGFALGLFAAAAASVALLAVALNVVTRRWDSKVFLLMLLTGVVAILLTFAIAYLFDIRDSIPVLFVVGEPLMAALCGYWLLRATPGSEGHPIT